MDEIKDDNSGKYFSQDKPSGSFVPESLAQDIMLTTKFLTFVDSKEIFWFDRTEGIWELNGEVLIRQTGTELLGKKTKQNYLNETIDYIKSKTYTDRKIFDNQNLNLMPLKNGVLNLETMKLMPYSPDFYFTSKLNVKYDPNVNCPTVTKFLEEVVSSDDIILLFELAGYCLYRKYPIQKAFMLVGDGANGKSTFLNLIISLLGPENVCAVSLQDLERNRFASASLYRKLANIYADLPNVALKNPGIFKMLTGGDVMHGEKKFKDSFFFSNHAKLIFSANKVPFVQDESSAFYRRWIIINFPNKFEGDKANPLLLKILTTEEELSGFLNLALLGLKRILESGCFSYTKSTEEIREAYIRASDPIGAFIIDCIISSPEDCVSKDELYNAYCLYCKNKKLLTLDKNVFFKNIRKYVQIDDYKPTIDGRRVMAWKGIRLVAPVNDVRGNSNLNSIQDSDEIKIIEKSDSLDNPDTRIDGISIKEQHSESKNGWKKIYSYFGLCEWGQHETIVEYKIKDDIDLKWKTSCKGCFDKEMKSFL
ncbi:MAG: hypothetical protein J4428_05175 [Candidatus Aenigmarchaeota archaeon]|nr:hypothetical protein [Candidatus Aenigmarchaeota archaeon]